MPTAAKKACQVGGFLLLMSVLFFALSVSSYSAHDPTWNYYTSRAGLAVQNLGGIVGASLADWGLQALGSTAFLLVGIAGFGAWHLMQGRLLAVGAVVWRGGVLLAAVSAGSNSLLTTDPFFGPQMLAGGILGQWLASVLVHYLNPPGAYLVLLTALILALWVGVDTSALYWRWWQRLRVTCQHVRLRRPLVKPWLAVVLGGVRSGRTAIRYGVNTAVGWLRECLWKSAQSPSFAWEEAPPSTMPTLTSLPALDVQEDDPSEEDETPPRAHRLYTARQPEAPKALSPVSAAPAFQQKGLRKRHIAVALPSLDLLDPTSPPQRDQSPEELKAQAHFLEQKLRDFGVEGEVVQVLPGPVITMYEFAPAPGIKVSKIANLQDDLALVMRALSVRVVAPVPGKAVVGIEIPNKRRETVRLRELLDSEEFRTSVSMLSLALGKDILGKPVITDLALIPHLLIAGATGSGKSVGLNSMICSLLFRATPADVKMIMIDPKMLELSIYDGIPHLLVPVVTHPKKAAVALRRVVEEMERRYQLLAAKGVRSIAQYNQAVADERAAGTPDASLPGAPPDALLAEKLPYLVVVIDELSDLMMVSSREVEDALTRIAQMARAAGIHLIVATQRPSVDVLTGVIKANFPARVSFQVSSKTDSRTILDANGAEKLLGRGDMLFLAPGTSKSQRIHGAYVSEAEINRLVAAWKELEQPHYDNSFLVAANEKAEMDDEEYDEKYDEAVALVARTGQASISMLQRRLRVGYNRAARMIEIMEREGIIGPADGVKPREVLVRKDDDTVE
jgi:S-DNA-T family DNA segregation ATPase FtsK/SpoIIIE